DIDHLLHFAQPFAQDFAGFESNQAAERRFGGAQFVTEQANQLATARSGHLTPLQKSRVRLLHNFLHAARSGSCATGDRFTADGRMDGERAAFERISMDTEIVENRARFIRYSRQDFRFPHYQYGSTLALDTF